MLIYGIKIVVNFLKNYVMPWTKKDFPNSMKNLPEAVRNKAIEIANALLEEKNMDEGVCEKNGLTYFCCCLENRALRGRSVY